MHNVTKLKALFIGNYSRYMMEAEALQPKVMWFRQLHLCQSTLNTKLMQDGMDLIQGSNPKMKLEKTKDFAPPVMRNSFTHPIMEEEISNFMNQCM